MNCRHARGLFGAYWEDETTQAEREWLDAHFAACEKCRVEYEDYSRALELLGSLPRLEAAPDLVERVLQRARRAPAVPDRIVVGAPSWIPVTAAAVAVAVLATTLILPWVGMVVRGPQTRGTVATRVVPQPVLVTPGATTPATTTARVPAAGGTLAAIPDSLFDHSEDVEFILDPVTLKRGRPSVTPPRTGAQGQQATITF